MRKYVFVFLTFTLILVAATISLGSTSKFEEPTYYKSIEIKSGDTLWDFAEEYKCHNISTIKYVSLIKKFNNMQNDTIIEGQNILIPIISSN